VSALIVLHFIVCLFLVLVILLQPGKGDGGVGFGAASGSSQSIFGSRGAGNFLTKMTTVAACIFLLTSFLLTRERTKEFNSSVIQEEPATKTPAPSVPPSPEADKSAAPAKEPEKK